MLRRPRNSAKEFGTAESEASVPVDFQYLRNQCKADTCVVGPARSLIQILVSIEKAYRGRAFCREKAARRMCLTASLETSLEQGQAGVDGRKG